MRNLRRGRARAPHLCRCAARARGASYALVGLATGTGQSFTVTGVRNGTCRDAATGRVVSVTSGSLSFTVNAHSAGIYVLDGPGKIGQDGTFLR